MPFGCGVLTIAVLVPPAFAGGPKELVGAPEDWTHHHVIFSNPGTLTGSIGVILQFPEAAR